MVEYTHFPLPVVIAFHIDSTLPVAAMYMRPRPITITTAAPMGYRFRRTRK